MKKLVSIMLILCLLVGTTALASAGTELNPQISTGSTTITYKVSPSYTVTIPPTVTIGPDGTTGSDTVTVAKGAILPASQKYLKVAINQGEHLDAINSRRRLKEKDSNKYIAYTVATTYWMYDGIVSATAAQTDLFQVQCPYQEEVSEELTFALIGSVPGAGEYSDTLTFTVNLSPAPSANIKSFG